MIALPDALLTITAESSATTMNHAKSANVRTFVIEGQPVRCIETDDGKRLWLCGCNEFKERAARHPEGFCGHTAVAISRCIEDGSIEVRL